jgi:DNA-binding CsgD family transcriptional regulator
VLDANTNTIRLGVGYQLAALWYFAEFTLVLVLGYSLLKRLWPTDQRIFLLGLLIFASVGYGETILNILATWQTPSVALSSETDFLYSSIPYALYGIFLIYYFLHFSVPPTPLGIAEISPAFLEKYGITEREREIILKVVQGKSNGDIARELVISLATVKTHLHNIYQKIGINSRYDLLARVRTDQ